VVEIQFIHEAIASHSLTRRLEAFPNLVKNLGCKVASFVA
jgi:hypothetical protein